MIASRKNLHFSDASRVPYGARPGSYSSLPHLDALKETQIPVLKFNGCPLNKVLTKELEYLADRVTF